MSSALLLLAALAFSDADAERTLEEVRAFVTDCTPRDAGTPEGRRAADWIAARASALGVPTVTDVFSAPAPGGVRSFANVYVRFTRSVTAPWTVLVSHFDTKPGTDCPGANDGASTTALLLSLCRVIRDDRAFKGNVLLVWTDAEECRGAHYTETDGLQGSRRAAAELKRRGLSVAAVYVLDMLGDGDLGITLPANVAPELIPAVRQAAALAGLPAELLKETRLHVRDDHVPFLEAGFPAAVLIDFSYGTEPGLNDLWHTPRDTPERLSAASLKQSGALAAELLNLSVSADRPR